jgi:hypothetical protein
MTDPPPRPIIRKLLRALVKKVRVASMKPAGKQVRLHSIVALMTLSRVRFLMGKGVKNTAWMLKSLILKQDFVTRAKPPCWATTGQHR